MGYAAQAAGPMGEAVHYSLQYLSKDDRLAMAAYLKSVPAIADKDQLQPVLDTRINDTLLNREPEINKSTRYNDQQLAEQGLKTDDINDPDSAKGLYALHCASCHGEDGYGQATSYYASLIGNTTLRTADPRNLVAVIVEGVGFRGATPKPLMPGFADKLDHEQIASLTNYVREEFGAHDNSQVDAKQVAYIASGKQKVSALFAMPPLSVARIIRLLVFIAAGIWYWRRRRVPRHTKPIISRSDSAQPTKNRSDV